MYLILYIKSVIKSNFFPKKDEVIFLYSYDIINYNFLIINYKNDIKIFHLYKYHINK